MFRVIYRSKVVGVSKLESGDPSIGCASGELFEAGTCEDLSKWIMEEGGVEDDGVFLIELDNQFVVLLGEHTNVPFRDGSIICVPGEDEIFLELQGIPAPEYAHFFPTHVEEFQKESE